MNKTKINIAFIGAGSIGSLFGGYLAHRSYKKYDIEMTFFGRDTHINAINKNGLIIQKQKNQKIVDDIDGYTRIEDYINQNPKYSFKFVFLTTKAYDIENALSEYEELIGRTEWLVILQNGIGNEEIAKNFISRQKIIRAITSNGALILEPGKVKHTGEGFTRIGFPFKEDIPKNQNKSAYEDLNLLAELLMGSGIRTEIVDDIIRHCWEKVFVNIGINAFGALTRLRNGDLLEINELKELISDAIEEAIQVAELRGINLTVKNYVKICFEVARKTKNNINSMLQDIMKGKKTEIEFINGRIVKYSKEKHKVPINRTVSILIKSLEKSDL